MLEKVEGVVLRTRDYGETNKIVTLFTKEFGKIGLMARGARKPKSRMASVTQPFVIGQYLIQRSQQLGTMQQGEIIESLRKLREDIEKTAYAAYLAELLDKLVEEHRPNPFLFQEFVSSLNRIGEGDQPNIIRIFFELKLYSIAGFAPEVSHCVSCGTKENLHAFSIQEGGLLCTRCCSQDEHSFPLIPSLIRILQMGVSVGIDRVGQINVKPENQKLLIHLMDEYYDRYGGYALKSKKFLQQMEKWSLHSTD
ncbi:DNA repair protein RecO [Bacillaceae bacterium S4-13-58]